MDWVPFYEELASRLLGFRDDRLALIACLKRAFAASGLRLPKLEAAESPLDDIDPFTFLGTFNRGMTDANRLAVARALKGELGVGAPAPTSLDGIPTLNNLNATFYRFKGDPARSSGDIDALWEVFARAISLADDPSPAAESAFCSAFDATQHLKGTVWKLTMGLSWERPHVYLGLDGKNRWFLTDEEHTVLPLDSAARLAEELSHGMPDGRGYLSICHEVAGLLAAGKGSIATFPELSRMAWRTAAEVNEAKKRAAEQQAVDVDPVLENADDRDAPEGSASLASTLVGGGALRPSPTRRTTSSRRSTCPKRASTPFLTWCAGRSA